MPAVVTVYLRNPNLDQLNAWGGLDDLPLSLDDPAWAEADIFRLKISESAKSGQRLRYAVERHEIKARCHASATVGARCGSRVVLNLIDLHCPATATATAHCLSGIIYTVVAATTSPQSAFCYGDLRGHNWTVNPATDTAWTERVV